MSSKNIIKDYETGDSFRVNNFHGISLKNSWDWRTIWVWIISKWKNLYLRIKNRAINLKIVTKDI